MTKPRWFYAMPFRDELDMLRAQLIEHADRVDKFVIMEATVDHSGEPKDLVLANHWDEFTPWHSKIEHVVADWLPTREQNPGGWWFREQRQRDIGMPYLLGTAKPDDCVIVSDVDEFIPRAAFDQFVEVGAEAAGCMQKLRYAAVDWDGSPGVTAVIARAAVLHNAQFSLDTLRQHRMEFRTVIDPGGYHFSWFGGPERFKMKAVCSPHQESLETNLVLADGYAWERGLGGIGPGMGNVAEITEDYPQVVRDRSCPWYWWRPGADNLPVDPVARAQEVRRRAESPFVTGYCKAGRYVRVLEPGSYHVDDLTPCPTAA